LRLRRIGRLGAAVLVGLGSTAALSLGLGSWPACTIYDSSLLLPAVDSGPDSGATASGLARIPGEPDADDPSTMTSSNVLLAVQTIDLGIGLDGGPIPTGPLPPIGWDLDLVDTCPGAPSCVQKAGTKENCDDDAGRDHTGLSLFRALGATAQTGVAAANAAMQAGEYGLLVFITGYNGTANDRQVSVALFFSSGVLGPDGGAPLLNHDGTDAWSVDPRSIVGNPPAGLDCGHGNRQCQAQYTTDNGYVSNGVLVALLGDVPITFGQRANIGGAVMELSGTYLTGRLKPVSLATSNTWVLEDGLISGRWPSAKLLSNMATIPDPTSEAGAYLCGDADLPYQILKNDFICPLQDITSSAAQDRMGFNCDAISMAFGFTAEPAQFGIVAPLPDILQGCMTGGVPFFDSCPQ
jgi:hypothetical protein